MVKWSLGGTDLFMNINIYVNTHTIYDAFALIEQDTFAFDQNLQ